MSRRAKYIPPVTSIRMRPIEHECRLCLNCNEPLTRKGQIKFCSLECSNVYGKGRSRYIRDNWVNEFMKSLMKDYLSTPAPQSVCKHFGCGKHLSATDLMYSPYCMDHQNRKQVDITFIIKNK